MTSHTELAFLGEEFLTWLWFRCETGDATFRLQDGTEAGVSFDDFLTIAGREDQPEQTLRHGLPTRSHEATVGLLAGKRLVRARLILACDHEEWTLTLDGPRFALGACRPTRDDPDEIEDARDLSRMQAFVHVSAILDELFRLFLKERLGPEFQDGVLKDMKAWAQERRASLVPAQE